MTLQVRKGVSERAETILQNAVLAPSSHNTQPWRFRASDECIHLYADRMRALPVNDPEDRELTISCGCALMNLRIAAATNGLDADVAVLPDTADEDLLATVTFTESDPPDAGETALFPLITERRTYRKRFAADPVPHALLDKLAEAAKREGAWFETLSENRQRDEAAVLIAEGDAIQWADPSWRRELAAWMHPRREGDGLTVPWLVGPVAQVVVRTFDMGNGVGAKDTELARESPVLAVLGTGRNGKGDWLAAGQALERLLLTACGEGLQASYLNQPIQVSSLRARLQNLLEKPGFPQILLRLGYPTETLPASPRRDLEQVVD